jgi:diguanylate cyclase (GGDEF)-like protein/PAS domain S-box-containing protein
MDADNHRDMSGGTSIEAGRRGSPVIWAGALAAIVLYGVLTALHSGNSQRWIDFADGGEGIAAILACAACAVRATRTGTPAAPEGLHAGPALARRRRVAWALLSVGAGLWALGQVVTCVYEVVLTQRVSEPSLADAGFLGFDVFIILGLLAFVRTPAGRLSQLRGAVEGLFIAGGFLLCAWSLVIGSVMAHSGALDFAGFVNLAYPIFDAVALGGVFFVASRNRLHPPRGLGLLAIGITLLAVADSSWWYINEVNPSAPSVSPIQTGWVAGFLLMALAAARPPGGRVRARARQWLQGRLGLLVPALPAAGGTLIMLSGWLVRGYLQSEDILLGILAGEVLLGLVLLMIVVFENHALTTDLEARVEERTAALDRTERYYRALVQHSSDLVMVVGADLMIRYVSDSAESIFGFAPAALRGCSLEVFGDSAGGLIETLSRAHPRQEQMQRVEWKLIDTSGRLRCAESTVTNLLADPNVEGFVLNTRDDTDRVALADQLREQAFKDPLTGLPNRALLSDRAVQAFARSQRTGGTVALMVVDLDAFKLVNDGFGHRTGDLLLRSVAERLQAELRPGDTVARLGGDEFVILMDPAPEPQDAIAMGHRIGAAVQADMEIEGVAHQVTASIGIAIDAVAHTSFDQLLCDADVALYTVKGAGRNAVQIFEPSMNMNARERFRLQSDLRRALDNREFVLFYQPECSASSGRLDGFEALIRWRHPEDGLLSPDRFIPLAEETGLIVPIGRWVLGEAMRQAMRWSEGNPGLEPPKISVNVSAVQLKAPSLVADVKEALASSGIDPARVVLEVTESSFIEGSSETIALLRTLKGLGVRLAIDDFGTGYASISNLQNMPVDILKVDRSFMKAPEEEKREGGNHLLEAVLNIGQVLSLVTVAEGIEEAEQLATVRALGSDLAQGYLLGRPVPAQEAAEIVAGEASGRASGAAALAP